MSATIDYKYDAHELKLNLAKLEIMNAAGLSTEIQSQFFKDNIEENFWKTYDKNKKAYKNDPSQRNRLNLVKDLMQLFTIRIKRAQLGFDHNQRPAKEYVVNQAKRIFGHRHLNINGIKGKLRAKIEEIKDKHSIPLSYQYYGDVNPPGISITPEQLNLALNQAGLYSRDQAPQTSIGQNPAAFYSPRNNDHSANELSTPDTTPRI